jgi:hypothetical protein
MHEKLTANEAVYSELVHRTVHERQLLVVPAFQAFKTPVLGLDPRTLVAAEEPIPQNMEELRQRWVNTTVTSFHSYNPFAHDPTSYGHFLHPLTTEPYRISYR